METRIPVFASDERMESFARRAIVKGGPLTVHFHEQDLEAQKVRSRRFQTDFSKMRAHTRRRLWRAMRNDPNRPDELLFMGPYDNVQCSRHQEDNGKWVCVITPGVAIYNEVTVTDSEGNPVVV